jgi:receptor expression-enhancing protein 5/6
MEKFEQFKEKLDKALRQKNSVTNVFEIAEEKTGVQRVYLALGLIGFLGLWLMVGYGAQFLTNLIGFLYPAYHSVKAIESVDKGDDTKWLTYWVVYAFFSLIEFFSDIFLFWIPLYPFLKCVFLIFCMAPTSWNGSVIIYNRMIKPFVLRHQKRVDEALGRAVNLAGDLYEESQNEMMKAALENIHRQAMSGAKTD